MGGKEEKMCTKRRTCIALFVLLGSIVLNACAGETVEVTRVVTEKETVVEMVVQTVVEKETVLQTVVEERTVVQTVLETVVVKVTPTPLPEAPAAFKAPDPETFTYVDADCDIDTMDPNLVYDVGSAALIMNVMEGLIFFNRENMTEYVPLLATSVPSLENGGISEDGLTYTFPIRHGVEFHNGNELTPSDFEYTFERGLLQSDPNGPQWLLIEPLLGYDSGDVTEQIADGAYAGDPEGLRMNAAPEELISVCEKVKAAIEADDEAFTLTFHLAQPWGPFLATLAQSWGSAIDTEWAIENGAWDGSCETWQDHYAPGSEYTELGSIINGTGPYKLHHWTPGEEWMLVANENYWRQPGDEMWPGGPSGPPRIKSVVCRSVQDWGTRFAMLQVGDADAAYVPTANRPQVEAFVGELCDYLTDECEPHREHSDAPFRAWPGLPSVGRAQLFMNFDIKTDDAGRNPYIGSGRLDGKGIPPEFFSDVHVRRAFNYCFDYDIFIEDALNGEGIRNNGPIIVGVLGYNSDGPMYEYDLEKCEKELAQAWEGTLPDTGFRVQMVFPTGAPTAETAAAILQSSLRLINEKYQLELLGLARPARLQAFRAGQLPLTVSGWVEDIHDPHNWAQPFTVGVFARRMGFPDELRAQFENLVTAGVSGTDPKEREQAYFRLQEVFHEQAPVLILPQQAAARYEQRWIHGWYHNPIMFAGYFYAYELAE
jgi:peptide/nickel transport system substrate-binding protein